MTRVEAPLAERRICAESLARHGRSFALAALFLPPAQRERATALYAWCRRADDAIDLSPQPATSLELERLRGELSSVYAGEAQSDPVLAAFQRVVTGCRIPIEYPSWLLDGFAMDVAGVRYRTLDELLVYCFRVAGTVGLMMAHVLGVHDARALRPAAQLGIAMQLTNVSRDVGEDWQRGRLYVPRDLLGAAACEPGGSELPALARPMLSAAVRRLLGLASLYYRAADSGVPFLSFRAALAIRAARAVYSAIGGRIRAQRCDPAGTRAAVPPAWKLGLVVVAVARSLLELPRRVRRPFRAVPVLTIVRYGDVISH